jgi:hypothetical protein
MPNRRKERHFEGEDRRPRCLSPTPEARSRADPPQALPAGDTEINTVLPASPKEFDAAYARGKLDELMAKLDASSEA